MQPHLFYLGQTHKMVYSLSVWPPLPIQGLTVIWKTHICSCWPDDSYIVNILLPRSLKKLLITWLPSTSFSFQLFSSYSIAFVLEHNIMTILRVGFCYLITQFHLFMPNYVGLGENVEEEVAVWFTRIYLGDMKIPL